MNGMQTHTHTHTFNYISHSKLIWWRICVSSFKNNFIFFLYTQFIIISWMKRCHSVHGVWRIIMKFSYLLFLFCVCVCVCNNCTCFNSITTVVKNILYTHHYKIMKIWFYIFFFFFVVYIWIRWYNWNL